MKYGAIGTDPATRREMSLGAMLMGSRTDEATSFAILDRDVAVDLELTADQRARLDSAG